MMKNYKLYLLTILFISLSCIAAWAVNALPEPIHKILPDGSTLTILLKGNEFHHYRTTEEGFLIQKDSSGFYQYARHMDKLETELTGIRAHNRESRSLEEVRFLQVNSKNLLPDSIQVVSRMQKASASIAQNEQLNNSFPKFGSPRSVVILVNFSDIKFTVSNPKTAYTNLLNEVGYSTNGGTGSARDYFKASSNGNSSPTFDVYGPYTLSHPESYYGANDSSGDDQDPRQMVIDACNAANADIKFSNYDEDNDGVVDNIFVYYAGHNEAEGANENTIWPHRWSVNTSLTLDGVRIYGYACTSELTGSAGSNMCGIGTFCHEFGHVYGLSDYYSTESTTNATLDYWNIMDSGNYLNGGRTPPTYAAYDRFFLGWLVPSLLNQPSNLILQPLTDSNTAYMITQSGNSNLLGGDPSPTEFFMLENRQQKGWDTYLKGHGMLITRIKYNAAIWADNKVNATTDAMYVDLMEADKKANYLTYSGDPFPGTRLVRSFTPTLMDGTVLSQTVTNILEAGETISFSFMGGGNTPMLTASSSALSMFSTYFHTPSATQRLDFSGTNLLQDVSLKLKNGTHFKIREENASDTTWVSSLSVPMSGGTLPLTGLEVQYNPAHPIYDDVQKDTLLIQSDGAYDKMVIVSGQTKSDQTTLFSGKLMKLKVYQDATGRVMVDMSTLDPVEGKYTLSLCNMLGQLIYTQETEDTFIEIGDLPLGQIFLVDVNGVTQKFIR